MIIRDIPLPLVLLAVSLQPAFEADGTAIGTLPDRPFDALAVLVILVECLPLAVRRLWPAACLAFVGLGFGADQLLGYHSPAGIALLFAVFSAGAHLHSHRRVVPLLGLMGLAALGLGLELLGGGESPADLIVFALALVCVWVVGAWLRMARKGEEERRIRAAEDVRTQERARIARELHDVVTHHVTAMVVQAQAARYLASKPDRLDASLSAIADTGRYAVADLRQMLGVLDPGHDVDSRSPTGGGMDDLVVQTRRAGQPIEFVQNGTPPEAAGDAERTAYRVVQEALTNAMKYASGHRTVVRVAYEREEIAVMVTTIGTRTDGPASGGSGRGLAGLRLRVEESGGTFTAGPDDSGFVVRAQIRKGRTNE